jgi:hypothetical protein
MAIRLLLIQHRDRGNDDVKNPSRGALRVRVLLMANREWRIANEGKSFSLFATHHSPFATLSPFRGRRSAERRMPSIVRATVRRCRLWLGRGRAPRRQKCTQSAHLICVRGALAFRRFARGTRHRLLPRWLSSRPLFPGTWQSARSENHAPAKTAKRVFCPPSPVLVQRAPRGPVVVPDDGAPEPPGNGLQNRARAPHSLRFQECPREGVPHERDLPKVAERGTFVKISSRYQ